MVSSQRDIVVYNDIGIQSLDGSSLWRRLEDVTMRRRIGNESLESTARVLLHRFHAIISRSNHDGGGLPRIQILAEGVRAGISYAIQPFVGDLWTRDTSLEPVSVGNLPRCTAPDLLVQWHQYDDYGVRVVLDDGISRTRFVPSILVRQIVSRRDFCFICSGIDSPQDKVMGSYSTRTLFV